MMSLHLVIVMCYAVMYSALNDNEWHRTAVVVDELSFRLSAEIDGIQHKSAPLYRCLDATPLTDRSTTRPVLISLASSSGIVVTRGPSSEY